MMPTTRPVPAESIDRPASPAAPAPGHPGRRVFSFVLFGIVLAAGTIIGASWINHGGHNPDPRSEEASASVGPEYAVGFGFVDVDSRVLNLYPVQPGEVTDIPQEIRENAPVKKGELLFRMDDRQARFNVQLADDALKDAKLKLEQAEKMPEQHDALIRQQEGVVEAMKRDEAKADALYQKADRLFKSQPTPLVPKEDRDAAEETLKKAREGVKIEDEKLKALKLQKDQIKLDISRAKVDVSVRKTRWEQAKYTLEKCELRAPCDGTVLRLLVSVGDVLGPTPKEPAVIFCPDEVRIIRAEVEQEFASKVQVGQPALIEDDARLAGKWQGEVKRISDWYLPRRSILMEPRQFNDVRTLECIIKLDDARGLKIGQRVRVIFGARN
jgi:multidrug resistance efflux pump